MGTRTSSPFVPEPKAVQRLEKIGTFGHRSGKHDRNRTFTGACVCLFFVVDRFESGRVPGKREVPCGRRSETRACLRVDSAWERSGLGMSTEFAFLGGGGEYGCLVMVVELAPSGAALRAVYGTAHIPVYRSKMHFSIGFHPIVVN